MDLFIRNDIAITYCSGILYIYFINALIYL